MLNIQTEAMHKNKDKSKDKEMGYPLFMTPVSCTFGGPATEYLEGSLSLDEHLIKHPSATFFVRAKGECMAPTIQDGDLLLIDRALEATSGSIILAVIDGEFTVKRLFMPSGLLKPDNPNFKDIFIGEGSGREFSVWGVVSYVIRKTY